MDTILPFFDHQVDIFNLEHGQKLPLFWPPTTFFCPRSHWMSSLSPMFCSSHIFVFRFWYFGHFSFPYFPRFAFLALQNVNKDCIIFSYFHIMTSSPKVTKNQKPKMGWTKKRHKGQNRDYLLGHVSLKVDVVCSGNRSIWEHTTSIHNGENDPHKRQ